MSADGQFKIAAGRSQVSFCPTPVTHKLVRSASVSESGWAYAPCGNAFELIATADVVDAVDFIIVFQCCFDRLVLTAAAATHVPCYRGFLHLSLPLRLQNSVSAVS